MAERKTPRMSAVKIGLGMAAGAVVEAGKLAAVNAAGYAVAATDAANLKIVGVFAQSADNSAGANGDVVVEVERMQAFLLSNSSAHACTVADIGGSVVVEDAQTVAHSSTNSIAAGKCLGFEDGGVWVFIA